MAEDFVLRMLDKHPGFTVGKLYPCYKLTVYPKGGAYFLVNDDSGRAREIQVSRMGIVPEVARYLRQQAGMPEELEKKPASASERYPRPV